MLVIEKTEGLTGVSKVRIEGGSCIVSIPARTAQALRLQKGEYVEITIKRIANAPQLMEGVARK